MFESIQDAINFADEQKSRKNDGGVPRFFLKAVAQRKGEEVEWEDQVWVEIFNKGDPKNIMERPKRKEDETRWPEFWKAYLNDADPELDGIPLTEFPQITPAERERCKSLRLMTVEDLANYPDGQINDLGGRGFHLKKAAREFIDYREGESITELKDMISQLKSELEELKSGGHSTTDSEERSTGDESPSASKSDERGPRSGRASVSDFRDIV